mmetsp:Transcript_59970/g.140086  ORF Transcript_59970/g.140086 Transcript_59970/m.140086 type:complete len:400 (-) Transcript_59970:113-1312(-)
MECGIEEWLLAKVIERLPIFDALPLRAASQGLRGVVESTAVTLLAELTRPPSPHRQARQLLRGLAQAHAPPRLICIGGYNSNWNRHEPVSQVDDAGGCETSAEVVCSITGDQVSSQCRRMLPPMLQHRADLAVASAGVSSTTLFALGGRHGEKRHCSVERLDLLAWELRGEGWQPMPPMLAGRSGLAAGYIQGSLIVAGGRCSAGVLREAECCSVTGESFVALPSMTEAREYAASAVVGSDFWVLGGGETGRSSSVEIWNAEVGCWRTGPEMRERRYGASAVWHGGRLVVVGGSYHFRKRKLTTLECLDPREGVWSCYDLQALDGPGYQSSLWGSGVTASGNSLFIAGGAFRESEESLSGVYSLDLRTFHLRSLSAVLGGPSWAGQLQVPRWCGGACIV